MSLEENRNCGCGNCMKEMMQSTNITNGKKCGCENSTEELIATSNAYNGCGCEVERTIDCEHREEMLQQIRCHDFAITELALYLDTHPDDEKALCLHRKYAKQARDLKDKYQKVYGPLTINYPCNKWRWLEEPWVSFGLGEV